MASLNDLLNEINTHPLTISLTPDNDYGTYIIYNLVYIDDVAENEARSVAIVIHIKFRDNVGGTEVAYYRPKPNYLKSTTFKDACIARIVTYKAANTEVEEYEFVVTPDEVEKKAFIKVWWNNAGTTEIQYYFLWEDDTTAIQVRPISNWGT
jgi:hypothetical protein